MYTPCTASRSSTAFRGLHAWYSISRLAIALAIPPATECAYAVTVEPAAVEAALDSADLVAEIVPLSFSVSAAQEPRRVITRARVAQVQRAVDSEEIADFGTEIEIESFGGEVAGEGVTFSGSPRPYVGRRYEASLKKTATGRYQIVGFDWGLRPVDGLRTSTRNRTDGSNGSGSGAFLHWEANQIPVPYFISLPTFQGLPTFADAIDASFKAWTLPSGTVIDFVPMGCTSVVNNYNDGINAVILLNSGWPFDPTAIAITRNFYVTDGSPHAGMILDSDILLNGQYHQFTTTGEAGKHDVQNIVTHESGHFIGFGHEADPFDDQATMYAMASPGELIKRVLKADDRSDLYSDYSGTLAKNNYGTTRAMCAFGSGAAAGCLRVHGEPKPMGSLAWLAMLIWIGFVVYFGRIFSRLEEP